MSLLPAAVREGVERLAGARVTGARSVGGGMVGRTARVETERGAFFVKWKEGAPPRWFEMEEDGLNRLRQNCPLRIPQVIGWSDAPDTDPPFLVLEWLDTQPPADRRAFDRKLGDGLGRMHRNTVSPTGQFGLEVHNFLGSQPQPNAWTGDWADFYRDRRLIPQIERARRLCELPAAIDRELMRLIDGLEAILEGHAATPRLIHGDLWTGNLLECGPEPALIDPAVYYADREMELAYMQLFSGFSRETFAAYEAAFPLREGYLRRRPLHQLYPLLIHVNHFGASYLPQVAEVCRVYGHSH